MCKYIYYIGQDCLYIKGVPVQPPIKLEREVEGAGNCARKYQIRQPGKKYRWGVKTETGQELYLGRTISGQQGTINCASLLAGLGGIGESE